MKLLITHHGKFHADDVFATAWLKKIYGNITVRRIDRNEVNQFLDSSENFIYDIGNGKYDHHSKECKEYRQSGIPYASFGKIVRDTYSEVGFDYETYLKFDKFFISPIDKVDNEGPNATVSQHSDVIRALNQDDLYGNEQMEAFDKAVNYAETVLNIMINKYLKDKKLEEIATEIAKANRNTNILVLDKYYPISSFKNEGIKFIIYPDFDHWNCNSTDVSNIRISETATANLIFRHITGSFASFKTKSDAIKAAEMSLFLSKPMIQSKNGCSN